MPVLALLVILPLVGALAVALIPARRSELIYPVAIIATIPQLVVAGYILVEFELGTPALQFGEEHVLIESLGIGWIAAIDGISLFMVAITALLFPLAVAASRSVTERVKTFMVLLLVLQAGVFGVFIALDLLFFFAFFEIVLVPMYLLIRLWGSENRAYAALKFVLFTAFGSAFLLAAIIALAVLTGDQFGLISSFDFRLMVATELTATAQLWLFLGFAIAFAIKVPIFPFHTWLPDAHTEAPTAGSVILAGVLLKMGTYGLIRFNLTLFPDATVDLAFWMALFGVIGIVYGGAVAIVQPDIKRLVAYSSVSHMGFAVLGIFALTSQGLQGSIFLSYSHALTTGMLFLLVGMIYDRTHTRAIADYGGLASIMPLFAGAFLFAAFASAGLPGLSGFIGEFTVLVGSYLTLPVLAIIAGFGVILAAIYLLWAYERVFTGPVGNDKLETLKDIGVREVLILVPLVVLILVTGVYPKPILERIEPSVEAILMRIEAVTDYDVPEFGTAGEQVDVEYGPIEPGEKHDDSSEGSQGEQHGDEGEEG
ncbi:MAG: NADH-quinone oxidoreductase subunit M [Acidimicrobiia bacterium]|nr:NADH-quinone oxidoreductase subunit M [Acidimicrobiia bacterium]